MIRNRAVALGAVLTLFASAGCSGDSSPLPPVPQPSAPAAQAGSGSEPAAPAPACDPRASLRPVGALPAPGRMPADTLMAKIQKRGRLIVGTNQDTLLFSSRNPLTGTVEGFDIDMAREVAKAIFGDPEKIQIKVITNAQRTTSLIGAEGAKPDAPDLVVSTMTANCDRWQRVNFSTIYYEAGQKVLVRKDSTAQRIQDLTGQRICAAQGSTSYDNIAKVAPGAKPVASTGLGDCLVAFQLNQVEAVTSDDTVLNGMAAQDPFAKVVGPQFTKEPYAIAMSREHPEFTRFVNAVLERMRADGTWTELYKRWLGRSGPVPRPPAAQYR